MRLKLNIRDDFYEIIDMDVMFCQYWLYQATPNKKTKINPHFKISIVEEFWFFFLKELDNLNEHDYLIFNNRCHLIKNVKIDQINNPKIFYNISLGQIKLLFPKIYCLLENRIREKHHGFFLSLGIDEEIFIPSTDINHFFYDKKPVFKVKKIDQKALTEQGGLSFSIKKINFVFFPSEKEAAKYQVKIDGTVPSKFKQENFSKNKL